MVGLAIALTVLSRFPGYDHTELVLLGSTSQEGRGGGGEALRIEGICALMRGPLRQPRILRSARQLRDCLLWILT